jgi:hypothetical protein
MDVCSGCARIDIAVINGKIHGFEIKSEQDNLERLPSQVELYNNVFDTITIVAAENHFNKLNEIIPKLGGTMLLAAYFSTVSPYSGGSSTRSIAAKRSASRS